MPDVMGICPSCQHPLVVRELECPHCALQLRARFQVPSHYALSTDMAEFLRLFVLARGNLKELERILGVSYPTVRAKLDQLVRAFDPEAAPSSDPSGERQAILDRIARKELSVDEGLRWLDSLKDMDRPTDKRS